ncbi:hypothetical protein F4781DRAFT_417900 [Annulohypoxylon bovei var. microspora]|nr:hypothetical protein F4781DRAFT_417900 [Annulohypoxylon bovei var. microspora]
MSFMSLLNVVYWLLTSIKAWWNLCDGRRVKTEKRDPPLIRLPAELIDRISNELSPASRLILSQTCRSLHDILGKNALAARFSRDDCCEYLAAIARQRPDYWVCEVCIALHGAVTIDTPERPCVLICPEGPQRWRKAGYGQRHRLDGRLLQLDHRHIQLALKYTRLRHRGYREYLKNLLAPYVDSNFETYTWPYRQSNVLEVHYSAFPKIVMGHDGNLRYLLLSVWSYREGQKPLSLAAMGDLKICPHLMLVYGARRGVGPEGGSLKEILESDFFGGGSDDRSGRYFCRLCPTDLCVMKSPGCLVLSAWQDLGSEGSPTDLSWKVHVLNTSRNRRFGLPSLSHEPGSVFALYHKE